MICIIFAKSLSTFLHVTVRWYLHNLQSLFVLKLLLFLCTPTSRSITLIWGCAWGLGWVCVYSWEIFVLFGVFCWWDVVRSILWNIFQLSPFPYVTRPFHQLPSRYFSLNNHPGWLSVFTLESKCFHGDTYFFWLTIWLLTLPILIRSLSWSGGSRISLVILGNIRHTGYTTPGERAVTLRSKLVHIEVRSNDVCENDVIVVMKLLEWL